MKHTLLPLVSLLALSACTTLTERRPLTAKELYAEELLDLVPPTILFANMIDTHSHTFGRPQEKAQAHSNFMMNVDANELDAIIRKALLKHFTEQELMALVAFCKTPEGCACMIKMAPFAADVLPACAHEATKAFSKTIIDATR
jgi:hypothetical protein